MAPPPGQADPPTLRRTAERVVRRLQEAGHVAYFAGGCVRDELIGRTPDDYDVATDARPEAVQRLFNKSRAVGEAFGVVMVGLDRVWVEVATFRTEWGYADGRRPDRVTYSDAEHDARRRDFTVNGLFYDPVAERVIDYVGGREDLQRGVVRAIGDPDERFAEDYLRMLRAPRFAAKLGFELDDATARAAERHAEKLRRISRERIGMEVRMMMGQPSRAEAAGMIHRLHLDGPTLNEAHTERAPVTLARLPNEAAYPCSLAAWAIDRYLEPHEPDDLRALTEALEQMKHRQIVRRWRKALMLSNEHRDTMAALLRALPELLRWDELDTARRKRLLAREDWPQLHDLMRAVFGLSDRVEFDVARFERETADLWAEGVCPDPLLSGDDLIAAGFEPGPMFKRLLPRVYDAQLRGEVATRAEALELARRLAG